MIATTKIVWGFVEKASVRVAGYVVTVKKDGNSISATTNTNGFYQLNLGNLHASFVDGDILYSEAIGETNYYGESFVLLAGGTATQQIPTIAVAMDSSEPAIEIEPNSFLNTTTFTFQYKDEDSGPQAATISINGSPIVVNNVVSDPQYTLVISEISRKQRLLSLTFTGPAWAEGQFLSLVADFSDQVNNVKTLSKTIIIDRIGPAVLSLHPEDKEIISSSVEPLAIRLQDIVSGIDASSIQLTVDGSVVSYTFDGEFLTYVPASPYSDTSSVHWSLVVLDNAGNRTDLSGCFVVFNLRPEIVDVMPKPFANDRQLPISFTVNPGSAPINWTSLVLQVESESILSTDSRITIENNQVTFTPIVDYPDLVRVSVVIEDTFSLEATASWTFSVDSVAPILAPQVPMPGAYLPNVLSMLVFSATETGSALDKNAAIVTINGDSFDNSSGRLSVTSNQIIYIPQIPYSRHGTNQVFVQAKDLAGNEAIPLDISFLVDDESPIVISATPTEITSNLQPIIMIEIDDPKSGIDGSSIKVTVNNRVYDSSDPNFSFNGSLIEINTEPFDPSITVTVRLFVKDNAGNTTNRIVSIFSFDTSDFLITDVTPDNGSYKAVQPEHIVIQFNKDASLDDAVFGTDLILESKDATTGFSTYSAEPIDPSSGIDTFDRNKVIIIPGNPFVPNRQYRLRLTNRVRDIAGNLLGGPGHPPGVIVFTTTFTYYQAGDVSVRGRIGALDLFKYAKIVENCDNGIVTPLSELVDLTGDGKVDNRELVLIENIILEENTANDISVNGSVPITAFPVPVVDGDLNSLALTGFSDMRILDKVTGRLSIEGTNIAALQLDITFDETILSLIDVQPVNAEIFRFRLIEPGRLRLIFLDLDGSIQNDVALFSFRVIGAGISPLIIDPLSIEAVSTGEAIIFPNTITDTTFATLPGDALIASIRLDPDIISVPIGSREVFITARLQDSAGIQLFAESVPIEWTVFGNGFMLQGVTYTNNVGESRNLLHMSGPVNSAITVTASLAFDPSVMGATSPIRLFDDYVVSLRIIIDKTTAGTGEPVQLTAMAMTMDGQEFETSDILWEVEGDAIVSASGEFTAFSKGEYRVRGILKSNEEISALSPVISISSVLEFFNCHDQPISIDSMTGFPKISLGSIFAGKTTGTQEIRIRNSLPSTAKRMAKDLLLNLEEEVSHPDLRTQFYPIISSSLSLKKRGKNGIIQEIPLENGHQEDYEIRALRLSDATPGGIVTVYLKHVNVYDVAVFNCGLNACIGKASRSIFLRQKDHISQLHKDGDFFVDTTTGRIFIKITSDVEYPGKLCYFYRQSATVAYRSGRITLDEQVLLPNDSVIASYSFISGTVENVVITVADFGSSEVLISLDGINFSDSINIEFIPASEMVRIYVRAISPLEDDPGMRSAEITIEADIASIAAC